MSKDKKSKSAYIGCLGVFVIFFISLVMSIPLAKMVATEKLDAGVAPPTHFKVVATINKGDGIENIPLYYRSLEETKKAYPNLTLDIKPGKGTIETDEEFIYTNFTVREQEGKKKVTVISYNDDYTYISVYEIKGEKTYPISHLTWGPGIMGLMIPYALGLTAVFYILLWITKTLVRKNRSKKKERLNSEEGEQEEGSS